MPFQQEIVGCDTIRSKGNSLVIKVCIVYWSMLKITATTQLCIILWSLSIAYLVFKHEETMNNIALGESGVGGRRVVLRSEEYSQGREGRSVPVQLSLKIL